MLIIGSHVSFNKDKQLLGSVKEALSYGANTFMFYTGAPQNTNRSNLNDNLTYEAYQLMKENNIVLENIVVHAPYIVNLANAENFDFNVRFLKEELNRVELLGVNKIVIHPGSALKLPREQGLNNIVDTLNTVIDEHTKVQVLLETMAGKGSELGINFDELKYIIDNMKYKDKIGVCLDTCHLNDAGYNIENFDKILDEAEEKIGLDKVGCIHINDSKNVISAHKDRHENFGIGTIGFDNLINVIYNKRIENIPKILETPYVTFDDNSKERLYPPYKQEIEMIKNKKNNPNLIAQIRDYYK
ncbi:MAG: deoxyribonuclease IV [Bacilli bacterium]|nr:deoxyribonuclease IV [Bacilli bacterium]